MILTPKQLHILLHTTTAGSGRIYRNHYNCPPECDSMSDINKLIELKLMEPHQLRMSIKLLRQVWKLLKE